MRCVIIGYGYWGKIIEKYVKETTSLEYLGVCDPLLPQSLNLYELVSDGMIDAAIVCTPIDTHYELVKFLLQNQIHVFCEKPLCKDVQQVKELIELSHQNNVVLYTDYIYTVSPSINGIKKYINELGKINYINMCIEQFGRFYDDDNVFEVIGVHMISVLAYLFSGILGDVCIDDVRVLKQNERHIEEAGIVHFHVGETFGKIECSLLANDKKRRIEILCEKGLIVFDMLGDYTIKVVSHIEENGKYIEKDIFKFQYDENNNLQNVLADFCDSINNGAKANQEVTLSVAKTLCAINEFCTECDK